MGQNRPVDTRETAQEALAALGLTSSVSSATALALELGRLYRDLGELDLALRSYVTALELQGRTGDVSDLCRAQAGIVTVRALRGDTADAAETLAQVRRLARADRLERAEAEIDDALALVERLSREQAPAPVEAAAPPRTIELAVLGRFELRIDGHPISDRAWRTSKAKELFTLLVLAGDRPAARDELIEALWPESDPSSGVSNFHFTLHCLRKALASAAGPQGPVARSGPAYRLAVVAPIDSDADQFQRLARRGSELRRTGLPDEAAEALRSAISQYRGEFLAGMEGDWIEERRTATQRRYLASCQELAEIELDRRRPEGAVAAAERYLALEPYGEAVHRLLLRAHHARGDHAAVSSHYTALVALLKADLGETPEPATRELYETLRARAAGAGRIAAAMSAIPRGQGSLSAR